VSECESYGTNASYLVWRPIWRAIFDIDPSWEAEDQVRVLERQLERVNPALVPRLPLLGAVMNASIPDSDLTSSFDAKLRKASLEALLVDYLRARAGTAPTLFVLEDCHWIDPLSHDLVEVIGRAVAELPVMLVLVYRPPELDRLQVPHVNQLPHFTEIELSEFTPQEAELLIAHKLRRFSGSQAEAPPALVARITARAQGNPFYIEELLNYLRDRNIDPHDTEAVQELELPISLSSLILSRLDQRTEQQRTILKVASVIGRLFKAALLWATHPEIGARERVIADLEALCQLDLTMPDTPEPELSYMFRHIVTQEVAYESLPYESRAMLHEQLASHIETTFGEPLEQFVDLLAYHYERSQNDEKKREYLRKAGEAAQADYANEAAMSYYQRLLPLLPPEEQVPVMLKLGHVLELVGEWAEADDRYREALALAEELEDWPSRASSQTALGELRRKQGQYADAAAWFEKAQAGFVALDDQRGIGQVLQYAGTLAAQQGDYETARALWGESLIIRQRLDDKAHVSALYNNLGLVTHWEGDLASAREFYEQSLEIHHELGDKWAIAVSLNNLGYLAIEQKDYEWARMQLRASLNLQREVGDRFSLADALTNLGIVARDLGDYDEARDLLGEGLAINNELGNRVGTAYVLEEIAGLAVLLGRARRALRLSGAAERLREQIGAPLPPAEQSRLKGLLQPAREALEQAVIAAAIAEGRAWSLEQAIESALRAE
jgi:tetratricopeptide (TPR) repeat protein